MTKTVLTLRNLWYSTEMSVLTINLPNTVEGEKNDIIRMIASRLYERGTLSLGQAAKVAGMPKWEFAEILPTYGVALINYPASELARDFQNA